jgi:hypothetical protein
VPIIKTASLVVSCAILVAFLTGSSSSAQPQATLDFGFPAESTGSWYCPDPAGFYPDVGACYAPWQFAPDSGAFLDSYESSPRVKANVYPGYRIARNVCLPCHVISPTQSRGPVLPNAGPSFVEIANLPDVTDQSLTDFIATVGWDMARPIARQSGSFSDQSAREVASYIMSLRVAR